MRIGAYRRPFFGTLQSLRLIVVLPGDKSRIPQAVLSELHSFIMNSPSPGTDLGVSGSPERRAAWGKKENNYLLKIAAILIKQLPRNCIDYANKPREIKKIWISNISTVRVVLKIFTNGSPNEKCSCHRFSREKSFKYESPTILPSSSIFYMPAWTTDLTQFWNSDFRKIRQTSENKQSHHPSSVLILRHRTFRGTITGTEVESIMDIKSNIERQTSD